MPSTNREADGIESAPEPFGAKATDLDPREAWRNEKAQLGGFNPPVRFTDDQAAVLNAVADTIIPPGGGFPAPSEVFIIDFISRYVTPADKELKYFPLAGEAKFKKQVDGLLGASFADASNDDRTATLRRLEESDDEDEAAFFVQLRSLTYYGYYARPEVTAAIRKELPAGREYHGPPQPYGYLGKVEPWPEGRWDKNPGGYIATDAVTRIEIPADIKAEYEVS
ncbi:MAG: gluconate 2-dehydrogenase subunit 3 family protein [Solirubrobacterales bacterium]|nr:gluconate 2-dehydrogenase subunit 3 family protein [Solirubrobacterales bacterium]